MESLSLKHKDCSTIIAAGVTMDFIFLTKHAIITYVHASMEMQRWQVLLLRTSSVSAMEQKTAHRAMQDILSMLLLGKVNRNVLPQDVRAQTVMQRFSMIVMMIMMVCFVKWTTRTAIRVILAIISAN